MAKIKVTFKIMRITEDDCNILAECPGVDPVHITVSKAKPKSASG